MRHEGPKAVFVFSTRTGVFTVSAESALRVLRMISSSRCETKTASVKNLRFPDEVAPLKIAPLLTLVWIVPPTLFQLHLLSGLPGSVLFLCQQFSLLSQLRRSGPLPGLLLLALGQSETGKATTVASMRAEEEGRLVFRTAAHLFLQQGRFPHSLSSLFLSASLLLLLPPPLLLDEALRLRLLPGLLLCPPALQLLPTLPGHGSNFRSAVMTARQRLRVRTNSPLLLLLLSAEARLLLLSLLLQPGLSPPFGQEPECFLWVICTCGRLARSMRRLWSWRRSWTLRKNKSKFKIAEKGLTLAQTEHLHLRELLFLLLLPHSWARLSRASLAASPSTAGQVPRTRANKRKRPPREQAGAPAAAEESNGSWWL